MWAFAALAFALADTAVRCLEDQYYGTWRFTLSHQFKVSMDNFECSTSVPKGGDEIYLTLLPKGVAYTSGGLAGRWSPVYMAGVDILIGGMRYFFISKTVTVSSGDHTETTSVCSESHPGLGWARQNGIKSEYQNCLYAVLIDPMILNATNIMSRENIQPQYDSPASDYGSPQGFDMHYGDPPPGAWSWGDVGGVSFLPAAAPAPAGRGCNSSYVEAALAAMTARVMVASNRTDPLGRDAFLSAQHVLDCSQYGQGCAGGTPFEVGKFSEDFGILITDYYLSDGQSICVANKAHKPEIRYYFSNYGYLGSYYGNTNAQEDIIWEIYRYGPVVASVYANADWDNCNESTTEDIRYAMTDDDRTPIANYPSALSNRSLRHFYASNTNHTVLIVGWGTDELSGDYWLVMDIAKPEHSRCTEPLRKISRGVNAYNIESEIVVMYWAQYPDFLHPDEYFLTVRCSVLLLMGILLLVFLLIGIVSTGIYISLKIRIAREQRTHISLPDLREAHQTAPLIPSGSTENYAEKPPMSLNGIMSDSGQVESDEISMLSNP